MPMLPRLSRRAIQLRRRWRAAKKIWEGDKHIVSVDLLFQELNEEDITGALCEVLVPRLSKVLNARASGHCMRVANLERGLMKKLCQDLRQTCPGAQIYILRENGSSAGAQDEALFV